MMIYQYEACPHPPKMCACGCGCPADSRSESLHFVGRIGPGSFYRVCDTRTMQDAQDIAHGLTLLEKVRAGEMIAISPADFRKAVGDILDRELGQWTTVGVPTTSNEKLAA